MSPRQALVSALHLFVVFSFFMGGFFFTALPYLPQLRADIADLLSHQSEQCTLIGLGFFLASLLLLLGFYALNRGRFLHIRMGENSAEVDPDLIRQTLEACFKTHYPKAIYLREVEVNGAELEIGISLASMEEAARE